MKKITIALTAFVALFGAFSFAKEALPEESNVRIFLTEKRNHLGDLLVKRLSISHKIAHHKWNLKQPIENPKEESIYLKDLSELASSYDIDQALVRQFFSSQIEAQKALEIHLFESWVDKDIHTHELSSNIDTLLLERKMIDIELLKNLETSKALLLSKKSSHMTELANQLQQEGVSREVIDDSLGFFKEAEQVN